MDFQHSERSLELQERVRRFMRTHVEPVEELYYEQVKPEATRYRTPQILQDLKRLAREQGLWNLFLSGEHGQDPNNTGLTNLEYAPVKEIMGRILWAPEVFNCSAPDVGNMEVLANYGTPAQQERWLKPLLEGRIRSGFSMTEPQVASSDATNIQCEIRRDGGDYVINGRKWFTSGAMNEDCEILIVMGKTAPDDPDRHRQQSMILVPRATPGVRIVRDMLTYGYDDAPVGHPEIVYENVRVPAENILLGEGRGFEIAQGRLGPGRIHHCMRLIGCAQRALELMCQRAVSRTAFGKPLAEQGSVREDIAHSFCEIAQARLLTLQAAGTGWTARATRSRAT
ncbi:acyl-CoA dehydrogenase [Bradyrhizobium sp. GM0.4]